MLQALRSRGVSSVIYAVLIAGMVLVFVLGFNPSAGKKTASLGEQCAARVRGHCITPKDHLAAYRILIPRGEQGEPDLEKAKQMGIMRVALDGLIERELLVGDAERLGVTVTEDEVTDSIFDGIVHVSLPADKLSLGPYVRVFDGKMLFNFRDPKTKKFDLKVYERTIKATMGRSPTEFREEQARELLAAKVRDLIKTPVRVGQAEGLVGFVDHNSTVTLNTITVRPEYVGKYLPAPSAKDADAWAADAANKSQVDAAVEAHKTPHLRHILVKVSAGASEAEKAAAKARLMAAVARVQKGEPFAAVAKEVSDDTGSAVNGGDVGDQTDGFVAPFKEAADKLAPGAMTPEPVETQFGYHIIRRDPAMTPDEMHHLMALELFAKWKADAAAKAMALKIQAGIKAGKDPQKVIDETIAETFPQLVKPAVAGAKGAQEAQKAKADKSVKPEVFLDRPDTDATRPQIVASSPVNHGGEPVSGLSPAENAKLIAFAFAGKDHDSFADLLQSDMGYVLASIKEHKTATKDELTKDKENYEQMLEREKQEEAFALYMARLKEVSKGEIKIDEKYLAEKLGTAKAADGGTATDEDEGP